ncbi:hypothetical protein [Bacillus thuringiensis]|uniref:Uncharacterized protein n=4 Tax=Bacillus thuringiensis TaxID=1428 RepID=A0A9X6LFT4_BACUH|nr:hypothetical protein [Bacillus thuringiensis]OUB44284.1 hypothetical protein BK716_25660 [Bacillus thuringiensis serovar higo]
MPAFFTPTQPMKKIEFDFEGYLNHIGEHIGSVSFFPEWKKYWLEIFLEQEEELDEYMKNFPGSNPILQRLKHYPEITLSNEKYEMFQFEHETDYGTYALHFDVERVKHFLSSNSMQTETIQLKHLYIDPETPVLHEKLQDNREPYFVRMYGIPQAYICMDGNKRMQARMQEGETSFTGYVFTPDHHNILFFGLGDLYYYILHYEAEMMLRLINKGKDEMDIYEVTQMYLQAQQSNM